MAFEPASPEESPAKPVSFFRKHRVPGNFFWAHGFIGFESECACITPLLCWSNVNLPYCHAARIRVVFANRNFAGTWQRKLFASPARSGLAFRPANGEVDMRRISTYLIFSLVFLGLQTSTK